MQHKNKVLGDNSYLSKKIVTHFNSDKHCFSNAFIPRHIAKALVRTAAVLTSIQQGVGIACQRRAPPCRRVGHQPEDVVALSVQAPQEVVVGVRPGDHDHLLGHVRHRWTRRDQRQAWFISTLMEAGSGRSCCRCHGTHCLGSAERSPGGHRWSGWEAPKR